MRQIILSILLAGAAAAPAFAQDRGRWQQDEPQADRQQAREERQQAREERQQAREQARAERVDQGQRPQPQPQPQPHLEQRPAPQFEQRQQAEERARGFEGRGFDRADRAPQQVVETPQQAVDGGNRLDRRGFDGRRRDEAQQSGERRWTRGDEAQQSGERTWTRGGGGWTRGSGDLRQSDRPIPNVMQTRNPLIVSNTPREGTQPPLRTESRRYPGSNWSGSWRNNSRYDWRNWRDRHRSTFRIGIYYDPFGWNYRPYQIGWRLWPSYYSRNYWINNPWQYRLPYAPPGMVWVRYWDDALLVDRYTGEVVDVIQNFFW